MFKNKSAKKLLHKQNVLFEVQKRWNRSTHNDIVFITAVYHILAYLTRNSYFSPDQPHKKSILECTLSALGNVQVCFWWYPVKCAYKGARAVMPPKARARVLNLENRISKSSFVKIKTSIFFIEESDFRFYIFILWKIYFAAAEIPGRCGSRLGLWYYWRGYWFI